MNSRNCSYAQWILDWFLQRSMLRDWTHDKPSLVRSRTNVDLLHALAQRLVMEKRLTQPANAHQSHCLLYSCARAERSRLYRLAIVQRRSPVRLARSRYLGRLIVFEVSEAYGYGVHPLSHILLFHLRGTVADTRTSLGIVLVV